MAVEWTVATPSPPSAKGWRLDTALARSHTPRGFPVGRFCSRAAHPLLLFVLAFASFSSGPPHRRRGAVRSAARLRILQDQGPTNLSRRASRHARCIACHGVGHAAAPAAARAGRTSVERRGVAQELRRGPADGGARQREEPAADASARETAGGDFYHNGGKHWAPGRRRMADAQGVGDGRDIAATERHPRIIQTNSAGDNVHLIDPATNKVVGDHPRYRGRSRRGRVVRTAAASISAMKPRARWTSSTPGRCHSEEDSAQRSPQ